MGKGTKNGGENTLVSRMHSAVEAGKQKRKENIASMLNKSRGENRQAPGNPIPKPPVYTNNPMAPGTVAPVTPGMVDATMPVSQTAPKPNQMKTAQGV